MNILNQISNLRKENNKKFTLLVSILTGIIVSLLILLIVVTKYTSTESKATIILSVTLVATFIGVYFFTHGAHLERMIVEEEMDYVVLQLVGNLRTLSPELANIVKKSVDNIQMPNMEQADIEADLYNKKLLRKAMIVIGIILIVGVFISVSLLLYAKNKHPDDVSIVYFLITNMISLFFVGLTYYLFTSFIIRYYKSADPNFVKKKILEVIKEYSGTINEDDKKRILDKILSKSKTATPIVIKKHHLPQTKEVSYKDISFNDVFNFFS